MTVELRVSLVLAAGCSADNGKKKQLHVLFTATDRDKVISQV